VKVIDFEIGWRNQETRSLVNRRLEFRPPGKVIRTADISVVRPAFVRLPVADYSSLVITHALEINRQIHDFQPEVIVGLGLLNAFIGIRLARKSGIPFVYYLIDELHRLVPDQLLHGLARIVEQASVRSATLVLSINRALEEYTISMGAEPGKTRVLPAGVDLDRYVAVRPGSEIRGRHGLDHRDLVLFFMGWVYPFSGLLEVAESLVRGEGQDDRVRLLVVGRGDSWADLARYVAAHDAEDVIKVVQFLPYSEMPAYLAASDVCLLPAKRVPTMENIVPIKMYEYLAGGKPVIATRLPGVVKEFGEGNGVVYVDDPKWVVSKAIDLAREGSLSRLGERGRTFVSGNGWGAITDSFESLLASLVPD
jgi:glycosyltransferase involved in cell wall biosynthesis